MMTAPVMFMVMVTVIVTVTEMGPTTNTKDRGLEPEVASFGWS